VNNAPTTCAAKVSVFARFRETKRRAADAFGISSSEDEKMFIKYKDDGLRALP
jgi:hypothetical protein